VFQHFNSLVYTVGLKIIEFENLNKKYRYVTKVIDIIDIYRCLFISLAFMQLIKVKKL